MDVKGMLQQLRTKESGKETIAWLTQRLLLIQKRGITFCGTVPDETYDSYNQRLGEAYHEELATMPPRQVQEYEKHAEQAILTILMMLAEAPDAG